MVADEDEEVARNTAVAVDAPDAVDSVDIATLERSALRAFYAGAYEDARAGLDRLISKAPTARAYLFLASSQVVAGLLGSEEEAVWLKPAVEDYQSAVQEGFELEPYREFISPRILELLTDAAG